MLADFLFHCQFTLEIVLYLLIISPSIICHDTTIVLAVLSVSLSVYP